MEKDQITTPEHDALVLKLFDKDYVKSQILKYESDELKSDIIVLSEVVIADPKSERIMGYLDVVIGSDPEWFDDRIGIVYATLLCIECKPKILSFGNTLRQINKYKSWIASHGVSGLGSGFVRQCRGFSTHSGIGCWNQAIYFALYTPDTKYDAEFESQGIPVIHP